MGSEFADRIYFRANELADKVFLDYQKEIDNILSQLEINERKDYLNTHINTGTALLGQLPSFLFDKNTILARLDTGKGQATIDALFREWYTYYETIQHNYSDFLSRLNPYESVIRQDIDFAEGAYRNNKKSLFFYPDSDRDLDGEYFYYVVLCVGLTFFFFTSKKVEHLRRLRTPIKGTGLYCPIRIELKKRLYDVCKEKNYIDSETRESDFLAAFSPENLPGGFKEVKWIFKNRRGGVNQTTLGALLNVAGAKINRATIRIVFHDSNGEPIKLGKLKTWDKPRNEEEHSYARYANIFREALASVS